MMCKISQIAIALLTFTMPSGSQPNHLNHDQMNKNGNEVMGFDQQTTTHHFALKQSGGTIQVTANDSNATSTVQHIRAHLSHISKAFADGDFSMPQKVHSQEPPGTQTMKKLKNEIKYEYSDIPDGGIVKISTKNKNALSAIHQFLQFQIHEHKTGDPMSTPQ